MEYTDVLSNVTYTLLNRTMNGSLEHHNKTPAPPLDPDSVDYVFYVNEEMMSDMHSPWLNDPVFYPTTIINALAFLVGVTGNLLVVFALLGDKKARNATSSFLVSLAVADLLFLLVCVPYEQTSRMIHYWSAGVWLCKVSGYIDMLSATVSILNLTAVSVER